MLKNRLFYLIICIGIANCMFAQTGQVRFKRLTIFDGLSLSSVYCIFQDSKGFMWFGTEDGLNRFDGRNFKVFRNDPYQSNSISYKWIDQIYEDDSGILWFGSRGGLTSYDPKYEIFTQHRNNPADVHSLINDTVTVLYEDSFNRLWIGTKAGMNRIDLKTKAMIRLSGKAGVMKELSSRINAIVCDANKNFWIATDAGLCCYNSKGNRFDKIVLDLPGIENIQCKSLAIKKNKLWIGTNYALMSYDIESEITEHFQINSNILNLNPNQTLQNLFIDKQNRFWIGTVQGLYQFDERTQLFNLQVLSMDQSNSQAINPIKPIYEDNEGNIWYGTFGDGLYKISTKGSIINYRNNPSVQTSLSYNSIHSIYQDRSGAVWFGTFGAGLSIYIPQAHKFELITSNPNDANSLSTNFVWSIFEAKDGSVWAGTNSKGIS